MRAKWSSTAPCAGASSASATRSPTEESRKLAAGKPARDLKMATQLNPSEISELIKNRIEKVKLAAESRNEGTIVSVSDGIVRIHGLADAMAGEMIELPGNAFALALNLERDSVGAVVLGDYEHLREGDTVKTTSRILEVPTGRELLGRVVNALGEPIDGK